MFISIFNFNSEIDNINLLHFIVTDISKKHYIDRIIELEIVGIILFKSIKIIKGCIKELIIWKDEADYVAFYNNYIVPSNVIELCKKQGIKFIVDIKEI